MAAAMRSLHEELRRLGNGLTVLYAMDDTDESAAAAVAAHAVQIGASTVIVDWNQEAGAGAASLVESALGAHRNACAVHGLSDDTLFTHEQALSLLGESKAGDSAKVLKWTGFLKAAGSLPKPPPPHPAPARLPPPCSTPPETLDIPAESAWWGIPTLNGWLDVTDVPISEIGGLRLAKMAGDAASSGGRPGFGTKHLGQRAGAGNDADGRNAPRPAYISPFLRWGVISGRQAHDLGVRFRDLLWRDFARLCWRSVPALRAGQPVTQCLVVDDIETWNPPNGWFDPSLATTGAT